MACVPIIMFACAILDILAKHVKHKVGAIVHLKDIKTEKTPDQLTKSHRLLFLGRLKS